MSEDRKKLNEMVDDVKEYINIKFNIIKLTVAENVANVLANLITHGAVILLFLFFLLFGSISFGFYLATLVDSYALGFLIVAAIYLLFGVITMTTRENYIEKPLINKFILNFFKDSKDDSKAE